MPDWFGIIIGIIERHLGVLISFGAVIIALMSLRQTRKTFDEHNRPYVYFNLEEDETHSKILMVVSNTGIRSAKNVCIKFSPPLESPLFHSDESNKPISELVFDYLSPGQRMSGLFSHIHAMKSVENEKIRNPVDVSISYEYNGKKYPDDHYTIVPTDSTSVHLKLKPIPWTVR